MYCTRRRCAIITISVLLSKPVQPHRFISVDRGVTSSSPGTHQNKDIKRSNFTVSLLSPRSTIPTSPFIIILYSSPSPHTQRTTHRLSRSYTPHSAPDYLTVQSASSPLLIVIRSQPPLPLLVSDSTHQPTTILSFAFRLLT